MPDHVPLFVRGHPTVVPYQIAALSEALSAHHLWREFPRLRRLLEPLDVLLPWFNCPERFRGDDPMLSRERKQKLTRSDKIAKHPLVARLETVIALRKTWARFARVGNVLIATAR
ncbi:hypothetical protein MPNT_20166 [Candidatus Methylacidithermus pantelleriae]|uniref:Transposase n=1 Tax=Candidatus Methylacidithermus pantelleriae TaxID=2744239 RepID=A0A8J2BLH5_9BACT|nr:hypothetical protein MPNT_20166 [Candidatus Methylacidithermus pantelleriae]